MPDLLYEQWETNDAGLTVVLEDLRKDPSMQAASRLTHQALALDYGQVCSKHNSCCSTKALVTTVCHPQRYTTINHPMHLAMLAQLFASS